MGLEFSKERPSPLQLSFGNLLTHSYPTLNCKSSSMDALVLISPLIGFHQLALVFPLWPFDDCWPYYWLLSLMVSASPRYFNFPSRLWCSTLCLSCWGHHFVSFVFLTQDHLPSFFSNILSFWGPTLCYPRDSLDVLMFLSFVARSH